MRKLIGLGLILLLTSSLGIVALGATPSLVNVNLLNIRSGPGLAFSVVASLPRNTELVVLSQSGEWRQVQTATGLRGWVHGEFTVTDPRFGEVTSRVEVTATRLNVRQGPGTTYPSIGSASEGQTLGVTGEVGTWYQVRVGEQIGFVHKDFVSAVNVVAPPEDKPTGVKLARVTAGVLNMRSGGGLQFPIVTRLNSGTILAVLEEGPWARVMLENGATGFVSAEFLTPAEGQARVIVAGSGVNQRSGPGTNFAVMANHPRGETMTFSGLEDGWVKVSSKVGEGYILGSFVSFSFNGGTKGPAPEPSVNLTGFKVVLDPGHGGSDPGAVAASGLREKDANLTIALRLAFLLRQAGAEVVMTRATDIYLTAGERIAIANAAKPDLFVSIHNNDFTSREVSGTETYYGPYPGSFELGNFVHRQLLGLGLNDRRLRSASFRVLLQVQAPAILTETAYLSNPGNAALLAQQEFLHRAADAHFLGISQWLRSR